MHLFSAVTGRVSKAYEVLLAATEINACTIDVLQKVSLFKRMLIYPLFISLSKYYGRQGKRENLAILCLEISVIAEWNTLLQ